MPGPHTTFRIVRSGDECSTSTSDRSGGSAAANSSGREHNRSSNSRIAPVGELSVRHAWESLMKSSTENMPASIAQVVTRPCRVSDRGLTSGEERPQFAGGFVRLLFWKEVAARQ